MGFFAKVEMRSDGVFKKMDGQVPGKDQYGRQGRMCLNRIWHCFEHGYGKQKSSSELHEGVQIRMAPRLSFTQSAPGPRDHGTAYHVAEPGKQSKE